MLTSIDWKDRMQTCHECPGTAENGRRGLTNPTLWRLAAEDASAEVDRKKEQGQLISRCLHSTRKSTGLSMNGAI